MKLNRDRATIPGAKQEAHARRPRHRLGQGQDRRARRQGPDGALRRAPSSGFEGGQMPLHVRCRSAASTTPFAKSSNEINLGRVQAAIDAGKLDAKEPVDAAALVKAGRDAPRARRREAARQGRTQVQGRFRVCARVRSPRSRRWRRPAAR